ncbi:MAG: hypothetical protein HY057_08990 [Rhodospirillales bacterium]|nr:hypothetical protein [Rhodospirillales bacterium]
MADWPPVADDVLRGCMEAFAQAAQHRPAAGGSYPVRGVFTAAHQVVQVQAEGEVSSVAPAIGLRFAEWPVAPEPGDAVDIAGATYEVVDVQPDGQGGATAILKRAE